MFAVFICLSVTHLKVVTEDMEVIESTISHLESFLQQYSQLSHMMQSLLEKLKEFTTSAISSVEVSKKSEELEVRLVINLIF